jgi:alpha-tubulin suppressor-like RCC1 family protein
LDREKIIKNKVTPLEMCSIMRRARKVFYLELVLFLRFSAVNVSATTHYVDVNSTNPVPPYTSWSTAAADIQDAIDVSTGNGSILVAAGVYKESVKFYGKAVWLTSVSGTSNTFISPPAGLPAVTLNTAETSNSVVCGFAITNGGIYVSDLILPINSSVHTTGTIVSNLLLNCSITCDYGASPFILYNIVHGSPTAGIGVSAGAPLIEGNIIENCAGGIGMSIASPTIINNLIQNNFDNAIYNIWGASDANIFQNIIINNAGDGIYSPVPSGTRGFWVINNTISGNGGNGIELGGDISSCQIVNNIVVGSPAVDLGGNPQIAQFNDFFARSGNVYAAGSVSNLVGTGGNISADPLFVATGSNINFSLKSNSACVNAGTNAYVRTFTHFGGGPRIIAGNVDMGAYEFQPAHFLAFEAEPISQSIAGGQTASFSVTAISPDALRYQWLFNGTNIIGANDSTYTVLNVQSNNAGVYSVVVSNTVTSVYLSSSNAVLAVSYTAPLISAQPTNVAVVQGATAMFSVEATGYFPIGFQWQFQGTNISGATNSVLELVNANPDQIGTYSVTVTNIYGSVTSSAVTLSVSPIAVWGDVAVQTSVPLYLTNATLISAGYYHALALTSDKNVIGWGNDEKGQIDIPAPATNATAVASGGFHSLALRADGTVIAWGDNEYGQLGVPPELSNVVAIAGGGYHSVALKSDGIVVAWGWDLSGQVDVPAGLSNVVAVAAGEAHCLALKSDGTVIAWGYNYDGELNIPSGLSNVVAIAAGYYFSMALRSDGGVFVWGNNSYGQTIIPPGLSNVVGIAAGGWHCLAVRADGSMVAWGDNSNGENEITTGLTNVTMIASGGNFNLALISYGPPVVSIPSVNVTVMGGQTVYVPGFAVGQEPLAFQWQFDSTNLPTETNSLLTLVGTQAVSGTYSLVVSNSLGMGTSSNFVLSVVPLIITNSPASQTVLAGTNLTLTGSATGWLPFAYQWLFDGTNLPSATNSNLFITNIQPSQAGLYSIEVGNAFGEVYSSNALVTVTPLALTSQPKSQSTILGGAVSLSVNPIIQGPFAYQWLFNNEPIPGATNNPLVLTNVASAQAGLYSVIVSNDLGFIVSSNAIVSVSDATGWGNNAYGQNTLPSGLTNAIAIAAGGYHYLALSTSGTVTAWGQNYSGQCAVPAGLSNVIAIAGGAYHSMALTQNGAVWAWGQNLYGQANVPPGLSNVVSIAAGSGHSLALGSNGLVTGWGFNANGETKIPTGLSNVVAIAAGANHSLALKSDSTVLAWGLNSSGQASVPSGLSNVVAIAAGSLYSMALRIDGTLVAWGNNQDGVTNVPAGLSNIIAFAAGGYHSLALRRDGTVFAWGLNIYGQTNVPEPMGTVEAVAAGAYGSLVLLNTGVPYFSEQPVARSISAGWSVSLAAVAVGSPDLEYQWQFDSTNIVGATNSLLSLTNVPVTSAGNYRCIVSNSKGSAVSSVAGLYVSRTFLQFGGAVEFKNGLFDYQLSGLSGQGPVVISSSTDLVNWIPIFTNLAAVGTIELTNRNATNSYQFYRAAEQ